MGAEDHHESEAVQRAVELTELRTGMQNIDRRLTEIYTAVSEIVKLDKTIAEMAVQNSVVQKEVALIWQRHDAMKVWQTDVDKQLNRATGARGIITIVLAFIQMIIVAVGGYFGVEILNSSRINSVQEQRINAMETRLNQHIGVQYEQQRKSE